jgi:predicted O-methyltransferase YrrM
LIFMKKAEHILNNIKSLINNSNQIRFNEDVYALQVLQPLLNQMPFIPFNHMGLRPVGLNYIVNEIYINRRRRILEFGSGITSVFLAHLAKNQNLPIEIVSVDENREWVELLKKEYLHFEKAEDIVQFVVSPLTICDKLPGTHWYDQKMLEEEISGSFDMIIVDGPTAFEEGKQLSRYHALHFFYPQRLNNNAVIFLDDVNRKGELEVVKMWEVETGINFKLFAGSLGVGYKGVSYVSNPSQFINYL